MSTWLKDLRFGARALMRMPGSAVISIVVLAIGIGLCSFMFSLVYGIYFRGMDVPESERVLVVFETDLAENQTRRSVPLLDFVDLRERQTSFEGLLATRNGTVNLSGVDAPMRFSGAYVTANTFSTLRVQPIVGRGFAEGDDAPGAAPNIVLSHAVWIDRFGGDRSIVGRDVRVNGEPATVLGVMPDGFLFPNNTEVWVPLTENPLEAERGRASVSVYGRLADGVARDRAEADIAAIARQIEQEQPESNEGIGARLDTMVGANMGPPLNMVFGSMMVAALCVLLVACANVANLLLARAAMRTKEAGIRVAMGGSRLRVMLPFFAEAFVLAAAGAVVGIGIAYVCVDWFDTMTAPARTGRPWFMLFMVDWPILGFLVLLTGLTALAAGVAPAIKMSATDVNSVLKDESRGTSSLQIGRLTRVLVTAEVALSCALLVGAGLMTKSIVKLGGAEYEYETDAVLTARAGLFETDYPDRAARLRLWADALAELRRVPQVAAAALTTDLPAQGSGRVGVALDGAVYEQEGDLPSVHRVAVSSGFFDTYGVALVAGRDFTAADDSTSDLVAVVNQPMVDRYFDGRSPIGQRFRAGVSDTLPLITVVGVAPEMGIEGQQPGSPDHEPAGFYVPLEQNDVSFMSLVARARSGEGLSITSDVRAAVRRVDDDLPIYNVFSQAEVIERSTWFFGVFGTVFIVFGAAALFMASVGLYGVLSFGVTRRTQEMGIRMALGADAPAVIRLVARQGATQLGFGLGIGLVLAFGVTRLVGFLMYEVDPQDPLVFGAVVALVVTVGVAAAVFPAWRATSVSPVEALRAE